MGRPQLEGTRYHEGARPEVRTLHLLARVPLSFHPRAREALMSDADFLLTELAEQEKQFQSARKPTLVLIPAFQHAP